MDSSLPVLVSRLPDRRALTRLVRAALRHEVAQVELASGPQRAEAHTLDLHVAGQPPLALLAEPAGAPQNGQFPLRLRPLYRAQAAQLYALLAAENVSVDGPPDALSGQSSDALAPEAAAHQKSDAVQGQSRRKIGAGGDSAPLQRAMSSASLQAQPHAKSSAAAQQATSQLPKHGASSQRQTTSAQAGSATPANAPFKRPSIVPAKPPVQTADPAPQRWPTEGAPHGVATTAAAPRRTASSANWSFPVQSGSASADGPRPSEANHGDQQAASTPQAAPAPEDPEVTYGVAEDDDFSDGGASADDPSLSVSVVFDSDMFTESWELIPPEALPEARHGSKPLEQREGNEQIAPVAPPEKDEPDATFPADREEPSFSVSVVFEPDALPAALREGLPSPIGGDSPPVTPVEAATSEAARVEQPPWAQSDPPSVDPPSGQTIANGSAIDGSAIDGSAIDGSAIDEAFFDDALANFPTAALDEPSDIDSELESSPTAVAAAYDVGDVALVAPAVELGAFDDGGMIAVPPPQDDPGTVEVRPAPTEDAEEEPEGGGFDDDADDDATLIRAPGAASAPTVRAAEISRPPEPIVHPDARAQDELTPTQQLTVADIKGGARRKQKSTRRKPKDGHRERDTQTLTEERAPRNARDEGRSRSAGQRSAIPADEEETAALLRPPVSLSAPLEEDPPNTPPGLRGDGDPAIGRRIAEGKYVIESLIGSGAAGAVYRATHRELRRTVAIKLLHPHYQQDPQFMTSFRGEALAASQLDHPNVMRVLDFGQEPDGLVYIVMEFLSGRTLQSLLDEERRLPTERAVEIMIQVCAALSVAHDHGIIHRDIKPDNIMLVPSRNDEGTSFELVKVCDFGIAALQNPRAEDAELAATEHVIAGTPEYMSPEQARGTEVDARSDVYACGICLYELVTGRPPFLGDNPGEILIKQLEEIPKPPSQLIKGLDPIIEEVILRAVQKDPTKRHQSAREMRVELKELIDPGEGYDNDDEDELSIVENVPVLDDPASGFPGFFIAFASAILRFGRFERGHHEFPQAMKELQRSLRIALRGRTELTFARRDVQKTIGFAVMSGTAEIVDLRRLLGSQLMGSFGEPFIEELVNKGIASLTVREGLPDAELTYLVEMMHGPLAHEELRKELLSKPLRHLSVLFVSDVVGRDRKLAWKVGLCASRLARDLRALCNVRGISLKKMRETRDELVGGVARLLTRGDEVKQFIFNADLVDEAVANLRGFSSFQVAPLIVERVLHESCAETASSLLADLDAGTGDRELVAGFLRLFAQRLVTERSPKSDAAVAEFFRRQIITEDEMPRDLKESIRAQSLADALVREPSQFLLTLDLIGSPEAYASELMTLEGAMATLARRSEAVALLAVMSTLARHAKGAGKPGPRENAALRTMKTMIDKQRLLPIATTLLVGPPHQREAARQLIVIAGSVGVMALYMAREATTDPAARPVFVQVLRAAGPAGYTLLSQVLPRLEVRDDAELALVEDLLRAVPDRADPVLGEVVAKFLAHPLLRPTALTAIVPLWGDRARKPLVEALEYAEEPARIIALTELRRLRAIDEYVFSVIERFLTMRGIAGEELRAAAAAALADVAAPLRARAIQLLSKAVEGKRGFLASLRGSTDGDESVVVMEAMGRALLVLDRNEGVRALKGRLSRSEGLMRARLTAVLQMA